MSTSIGFLFQTLSNGHVIVHHGENGRDFPYQGGTAAGFPNMKSAEKYAVARLRDALRPPKKLKAKS